MVVSVCLPLSLPVVCMCVRTCVHVRACVCVSFETVSLHNPSLPGTYCVAKATCEFIVIHLLLPPKS